MAFKKFLFPFLRTLQILTLTPTWGILVLFVRHYSNSHQPTPTEILVLFISSIIATFWALITFFLLELNIGLFIVALNIEWLVVTGLIFAVALLGLLLEGFYDQDCANVSVPFGVDEDYDPYGMNNGNGWDISVRKRCMMLKSAWALGVVSLGLFVISSVLPCVLYKGRRRDVVDDRGDQPGGEVGSEDIMQPD